MNAKKSEKMNTNNKKINGVLDPILQLAAAHRAYGSVETDMR
jgi:hypothetical protein